MDHYKLKMKIDGHEFEAEGPTEAVKEQFAAFEALVKGRPQAVQESPEDDAKWVERAAAILAAAGKPDTVPPPPTPPTGKPLNWSAVDDDLPIIMRADNRVVSLTVTARSIDEAVLLLLYGQKAMRSNDSVTGGEIMSGLEMSGIKVMRADRYLVKLSDAGDAIAVGIGRAKRYRLTNAGLAKARAIAGELIATVA